MPDPDHAPDLDATIRVAAPNPTTGTRQEPDIPQPQELAALLPGDNYTVESFLGAGGMGAVYKGTQVRLQRKVAIKIMRRDRAKDQGFEERFRREALAMAQLNHPNIVNVIDYGEAGADYLYIVMEFIDGTDLVNVIRSGEMTQETALKLLPQICDALQFAHDNGIVHRDIKPANILLTRDGRIKMADFGLAKRFDAENSYRTQSGYGMGTPDYAAPEQFMGDANVDHRADIYALGVMIYQMVTGTLPRGAWKPPSEKAAVDAFWDHIVARALQTDPHDRYASVSEIKTDLGGITPTTGAPRLAADGTQARKTAGMTAAKGSTTALTQAGGRPVTKIKSSASQDDVQPGTSSRNRVLMLAAAALVVIAGVYLAWEKLKPAPSGVMTTLPAAGKASYPQPKVWVDATQEVRNAAVKAEAGTVQGDWLQFSKGHALPLPSGKILRDAVVRMTFKGLVCIEMRKTPEGMHYQGEAVPGQIAGFHIRNEKSNPRKLAMKAARFVPGFDAMAEHELVMFTHGDLIEVWVDGLPMLSERDSKLTQGSISLAFVHHQNFPVPYPSLKKVEYGELTGAPVAAAAASLPASFSMWQVPLPTVTPDTEWTNLIPHIQPERDAFRGGWTVDDKGLQVKRAEWAYCSIPVQDPGTDYDLRYKVTRGEGSHLAMFFAFRKGDTGGYVPIDYIYDKNPAFADGLRWATIEDITNLDMTHPDAVKAKRKEWLPRGKTCTVLLQVREKEVIVSVDDEETFRWPADWSRIQQREGGGAPLFSEVIGDPHFGVGIYNCNATFHSIEMKRVGEPKASASASASSPATATKDAPFVNSLGMKFVPVPITGGPTDGKRVLFSVWETRVQDYEAFVKDSNRPWMKPGFPQAPDHAAVNMTWDDATAFCAWLTEHEHKKGKLDAAARYRMPSDHEWSCAVGISHLEDAARTPGQKDRALAGQFPWGTAWPPPVSAGNYAGEEMVPAKVPGRHESASPCMGFRDAFVETSPAGSFPANALGLHELGGNVWEWCEDWYDATQKERVLRGGGFIAGDQSRLLSSTRNPYRPTAPRSIYFGFRCVLELP